MKLAKKLKIGDEVEVIAGNDKGRSGKISAIFLKKNKVVVEGIRKMKKSVKPSENNKEGGFVEFSAPIDLSNVQLKKSK